MICIKVTSDALQIEVNCMQILMKVRKVIDVEVPGLGVRIKAAREVDPRSLTEICAQISMTTMNWYRIEAEQTKALPLETLRKIEEILNVDFGVEV